MECEPILFLLPHFDVFYLIVASEFGLEWIYIFILIILYILHLDLCTFETYLLRNGWTDLKNSFFVSPVLVRGRF